MEDYPTPYQPPQRQALLTLLQVLIVIVAVLCVWSIFLATLGYGTVHFTNLPGNATVRINGHLVTKTSVKLHPGTYQVAITSPATNPQHGSVRVGMLQTVTYHPTFQLRDPNAIASSVIGAFGTDEPVDLYHLQWLDHDTWLVGTLLPGNIPIALHYDPSHVQWVAAYFPTDGYPQDITKLPADIAAYVKQLETSYAPG